MTESQLQEATVRMATDPAFAASVKANPDLALAAYDLTPEERRSLAGLGTERVTAVPASQPLEARRTKTMIAGGAMAAVLIGGGGYAGYRMIGPVSITPAASPTPTGNVELLAFTRTPTLPSPPGQPIISYATGPAQPNAHPSLTVVKRPDSSSPQLAQDATNGALLNVRIDEWRNGKDAVRINLRGVIVGSISRSSDSSGDLEHVVMYYQTISIQYP